jgi:hypothetical protein
MFRFIFFVTLLFSFSLFSQTTPPATETPETKETQAPTTENPPAFFKHGLGLGIGQTLLFQDFADHGDDELAFDLFYQYRASYTFDFLANFHTNTYKKDDNQKTDITAFTLNIKGRLFDFDAFAPFLSGGLGMYWARVTRYRGAVLQQSEKESVLGLNFGLGADLQLNEHFSFGFAAFYHQPFNVKQDTQESINGSYMRLMATAFIHF